MKNLLIVVLVVVGCGTVDHHSNPPSQEEHVWLCYNPESDLHGSPCYESTDKIRGRYEACHWVPDDTTSTSSRRAENSFCWLLERESCALPYKYDWQEENCHYFDQH